MVKLKKRSKTVGLIAIVALCVILALAWNTTQESRITVSIILTPDRFVPKEATVSSGTTVVFSTTRGEYFWPASNTHPIHDLYPAFDPKEPIASDKHWSFRFTKLGTWQYHDHLAPYYTGTLTVVPNTPESRLHSNTSFSVCEQLSDDKRLVCYKREVARIIRTDGIEEAIDAAAALYERDPGFANPCHDVMHAIGRTAYDIFVEKGRIDLSKKTAYCAFGFYHGFVETLLAKGRSIEQAREFCQFVDKTLGRETPNARLACYHGIGHGSTDTHTPELFGNEEEMARRALVRCEEFAETDEQRKQCATGVFDSISIGYYNQENGLVMRRDDPLWLCHAQPNVYKEACYLDTMPAVLWLGGYILASAAPIVVRHVELSFQAIAIETLAENSVRFTINKADPVDSLTVCRNLRGDLVLPCIQGLGAGFMQFGKPEVEYEGAFSFCTSPELTAEEQDACISWVFSYIKQRYAPEKVREICKSIDVRYQVHCLKGD